MTDHRMLQIYFRQNQSMLRVSQTHELQKRSTRRCDVEASKVVWKLKGGASGFAVVISKLIDLEIYLC